MTDLLKRPGRLSVARDVIDENPELVQGILSAILIVEARARYITNDIEYTGFSEQFELQEDGNNCPQYNIEVSQDAEENISVEFIKVD